MTSDHWFAVALASICFAAMHAMGAVSISIAGFTGEHVTVGFLIVALWAAVEWRRHRGSRTCDAPKCTAPATADVSDEVSFCAEHLAEFYEAAEE